MFDLTSPAVVLRRKYPSVVALLPVGLNYNDATAADFRSALYPWKGLLGCPQLFSSIPLSPLCPDRGAPNCPVDIHTVYPNSRSPSFDLGVTTFSTSISHYLGQECHQIKTREDRMRSICKPYSPCSCKMFVQWYFTRAWTYEVIDDDPIHPSRQPISRFGSWSTRCRLGSIRIDPFGPTRTYQRSAWTFRNF